MPESVDVMVLGAHLSIFHKVLLPAAAGCCCVGSHTRNFIDRFNIKLCGDGEDPNDAICAMLSEF